MSKATTRSADVICEVLEAIDGRCMANDGPVPPTLREATDIELRTIYLAADAIRKAKRNQTQGLAGYLLTRIANDPRLAYYFDPLTESMERITAAFAEDESLDVEKVRETWYARLQFERPLCAECGGEK